MKNEETFQCNEFYMMEEMKKECHSVMGEKNSASCILHSAFFSAFTLLEVMIATALFGLVVAGTISVYIMCNKIWHSTSLSMQTVRESSLALSRLVYGMETNSGLRTASMITNINSGGSWHMIVSNLSGVAQDIYYNSPQKILSNANAIICRDVSSATATVNSASGTVSIQLTVEKRDGMFASSNTVGTLVKMRNKP